MPILWGIGAIMSGYGILGIIEHIQQKEGLNRKRREAEKGLKGFLLHVWE